MIVASTRTLTSGLFVDVWGGFKAFNVELFVLVYRSRFVYRSRRPPLSTHYCCQGGHWWRHRYCTSYSQTTGHRIRTVTLPEYLMGYWDRLGEKDYEDQMKLVCIFKANHFSNLLKYVINKIFHQKDYTDLQTPTVSQQSILNKQWVKNKVNVSFYMWYDIVTTYWF